MTAQPDRNTERKITIFLLGLVVGGLLGALLLVPVIGAVVLGLVILFVVAMWFNLDLISDLAAWLIGALWRIAATICDRIFPGRASAHPTAERRLYGRGIASGAGLILGLSYLGRGAA